MYRFMRSLFRQTRNVQPLSPDDILRQRLWHFLADQPEQEFLQACARYGYASPEVAALLDLRAAARKGRRVLSQRLDAATPEERRHWPFELPSDPLVQNMQTENRSRLEEFVRGRRVVLTGPSVHIIGTGKGAEIDAHDIVVRINFQWPLPAGLVSDFGSRIDILYHCCNGDFAPDNLLQAAAGRLRFACLEQNPLSLRMKRGLSAAGTDVLYFFAAQEVCRQKIQAPPSTGITAVIDLLSLPLKSLSVIGMTCWATHYTPGYQGQGVSGYRPDRFPAQIWMHRPAAEARFLLSVADADPRLTIDPEAVRIMQAALRVTSA